MPKLAKELSAVEVRRLIEKAPKSGVQHHAVGGATGLLLRVRRTEAGDPTGYWIFRYSPGYQCDESGAILKDSKGRPKAKRVDMGLGSFKDLPLKDARQEARMLRAQVRAGGDPMAERHKAKAERQAQLIAAQEAERRRMTFAEAIEHYRQRAKETDTAKLSKLRKQFYSRLDAYALPHLGAMAVADIRPRHVAEMMLADNLYREKTRTAREVRKNVVKVLAAADAELDLVRPNPASPDEVRPHLPENVKENAGHFAALPFAAMPQFLAKLRQIPTATCGQSYVLEAVELAILTATRSGEVRGARWGEFDLDAGIWRIPAERMKAGREHVVYLSKPAVALLQARGEGEPDELVFPGRVGELVDARLSKPVREIGQELGYQATLHGMRAAFRTWASEATRHAYVPVELSVAHVPHSDVVRAYDRSELEAERRAIMDDWAAWCEGGKKPRKAKVLPMRRAAGSE